MPLDASSLITTVGGASSNSFATLAEAQSFHELNFGSDAWFGTTEDSVTSQVRALVKAARRLNQENWLGSRVTSTQALSWPRDGVAKVDAVNNGFYSYGYCTVGEVYLTTEIPQQIKDAQCLLALAYLDGFADGEGDEVSEYSESGGVSVKFRQTRPDGELPAEVTRLISPLIQGPVLVRS